MLGWLQKESAYDPLFWQVIQGSVLKTETLLGTKLRVLKDAEEFAEAFSCGSL